MNKNKRASKNNEQKNLISVIIGVLIISIITIIFSVNSSNANNDFAVNSQECNAENLQENKIESDNNKTQESKTEKEYTQEELEQMALDYYEKQTGYRPNSVASEKQQDGLVIIQLYDNLENHNSTADWYTIDPKTAKGTDILENEIDLKK